MTPDQVTLFSYIVIIMVAHLIGDFVLQNRWMADGKSSSNKNLFAHIGVYFLTLWMFVAPIAQDFERGLLYALINSVLHMTTDFVTSRASSKSFSEGDYHSGFLVIGIDQTVHYFTLFVTLTLLLGA